jgi:flagellar protein FlaG
MITEGIKSVGTNYQSTPINTITRPSGVEHPVVSTQEAGSPQPQISITVGDGVSGDANREATDSEQRRSIEALKKAVNEINKQSNNSTVQFGIHEETNRITIKILDKSTREVIREFPPEKVLDQIAKAWELAGLMVDEKR